MASPTFSSEDEARAAYYGSDDGSGGGGGDGEQGGGGNDPAPGAWGQLQEEPTEWVANWGLWYQEDTEDPGRFRWFVLRGAPESDDIQALNVSGYAENYPPDTALDEIPHSTDEQTMRDAYQQWVERNPQESEEDPQQSGNWGEWQKVDQVGLWWIWGREHETEDRTQFLVAGVNESGDPIYLQADGSVGSTPSIFNSPDAVQEALDAYYQKDRNGEIGDDEKPTGDSPKKSQITEDAKEAGADGGDGPLGGLGGLLENRRLLLAGGAAVVGGYALVESGALDDLDLPDGGGS